MAHKQIRLPENTQNTYHYRANFVRKMRYSTGDSYLSLFLSYSESIGCERRLKCHDLCRPYHKELINLAKPVIRGTLNNGINIHVILSVRTGIILVVRTHALMHTPRKLFSQYPSTKHCLKKIRCNIVQIYDITYLWLKIILINLLCKLLPEYCENLLYASLAFKSR